MKLSLPNDAYIVRETGLPVEGRMKVYLHESDTYADVFTLEGSEYVQAENPQLLHAGLPEASLFTETGVYDIVIEQYIGQEGAMSVESPDEDFSKIDEFQWGLDFNPEAYVATRVDSISDLRDVDPSVKSVTVLGYDGPGDCPSRTYLWDEASVNDEDGGYVISSNVSDSGRWILMWGDEVLPASVYGVKPGDTANMNLLLNYPSVVGSFQAATAPCVRFMKGNYAPGTAFSTGKELLFDSGARFVDTVFTCPRARVLGAQTGYIAEFVFTAPDAVAHSSWFKTVDQFWHCGASTLFVDSDNFFTDASLRRVANLSDTTVLGNGTAVTSYVNGAYFQVALSSDIPDRFFKRTDYVRVATQDVGDRIFRAAGQWDPGLVASGHHQQYDYAPNLATFDNADNWLDVMLERRERLASQVWNKYDLDLEGRTVGSFALPVGSFNELRNAVVDGYVTVKGALTLYGCKADIVTDGVNVAVDAFDSEIRFLQNGIGLGSANLVDCRTVFQYTVNPADTALAVVGGTFSGKVWLADLNANAYARNKTLIFRNVTVDGNQAWRANYISMEGCVGSIKLDVLPYYDSDTYYYWNVVLAGNHFVGNSRVWFTVYATEDYPHNDMDGKVRMGLVRIVDNRFDTSDGYGIKQLHWHPFTHHGLLADGSSWEYHGNAGVCPRLNPGFIPNEDKWPETQGTNPRWRIYDGVFNLWAPYNTFSDGSVHVAMEPTGLNPYASGAMYALLVTADVASSPVHEIWGVRTYYGVTDLLDNMWDENTNNTFLCKLAMGDGISSVPTFNSGMTYFPGLDVV